ncbi:MAG: family 1 glycosylhydrolase [Acidimicrobiales bacterium]
MSEAGAGPLPAGFRIGVATSGTQTEGGYNGPGEPANNWLAWERTGRVEPSGIALDFWNRWPEHLDRAVAAGCDAFRLSVEWARCEPDEGRLDEDAFERYAAILDGCRERGMLPVVALHHFAHPAWLGPGFWLRLESPARFARWATVVAERLGRRCRHWITLNEPNALAALAWVTGAFPPGRIGAPGDLVRALDHTLAAHVLAHAAVHRHRPDAMASLTTHATSVYELDRLLVDVLAARSRGVLRADLGDWLRGRRNDWYGGLPRPRPLEALVRRVVATAVPLEQALPRAVAAVYDGPHERPLDAVLVDWYDPEAAGRLRLPGRPTAGGRAWRPFRPLWDDPVHPEGLAAWCRAVAEPGIEVWVAESGLCNRVRNGRAWPRGDGWDRDRFLSAHLGAMARVAAAGVPVTAYFHWTLADNWEWGSYEPRFGLHGVDRARGLRWSELDAMGGPAAATYRRLAATMRARPDRRLATTMEAGPDGVGAAGGAVP